MGKKKVNLSLSNHPTITKPPTQRRRKIKLGKKEENLSLIISTLDMGSCSKS
jgi:hypothetical protein